MTYIVVSVFYFHSYTFSNLKLVNASKISIIHYPFIEDAGRTDLCLDDDLNSYGLVSVPVRRTGGLKWSLWASSNLRYSMIYDSMMLAKFSKWLMNLGIRN